MELMELMVYGGLMGGGLEHFSFSHIFGIVIPIDKLIFFRGVGLNHQADKPRVFSSTQWLMTPEAKQSPIHHSIP